MSNDVETFVGQKLFTYADAGRESVYTPEIASAFLQHIVQSMNLEIAPCLNELWTTDPPSLFLIAGTGLGKTLVMPLYFWIRQMYRSTAYAGDQPAARIEPKRAPRIWIIEPKIAIVQDLCAFMNGEWSRWRRANGKAYHDMFGCKTKVDSVNPKAPFMFVTTGIFGIYARNGMFRPGYDVVIFDEAHDTLESDESVELGIGLCRMTGVSLQFMSATVDAGGLEERLGVKVLHVAGKRFPVWRHNTGRPIDECIVEIVENALVRQNLNSPYFPRSTGEIDQSILAAMSEQNRAKGMLIMVVSFTDERSDARRIERLLRTSPLSKHFEVGLLASEVLRDPERRDAYEAMLERWKRERVRYVLIATSVVEMGVTLPDLDFIVTMDSDYEDSENGKPRRAPLRTNALIQRIGRVGRLRPGIAYVTRDIEAPFSAWDDATFNRPDALRPERIRFPMATSPLTHLAYETLALDWKDDALIERLTALKLPTDVTTSQKHINLLLDQRFKLWGLGVRWGADKTTEARRLGFWLGRIDPAFAIEAHAAFDTNDSKGVLRALCKGVVAEVPLETVCNAKRFRDLSGAGTPDEDVYRTFIPWFASLLDMSMAHGHLRHRVAERISEVLFIVEMDENVFSRAFALLSEYIDNFVNVVGRENADRSRTAKLLEYHNAIRSFILLRS